MRRERGPDKHPWAVGMACEVVELGRVVYTPTIERLTKTQVIVGIYRFWRDTGRQADPIYYFREIRPVGGSDA